QLQECCPHRDRLGLSPASAHTCAIFCDAPALIFFSVATTAYGMLATTPGPAPLASTAGARTIIGSFNDLAVVRRCHPVELLKPRGQTHEFGLFIFTDHRVLDCLPSTRSPLYPVHCSPSDVVVLASCIVVFCSWVGGTRTRISHCAHWDSSD